VSDVTPTHGTDLTWQFWQRLGFRFMFAYVVLYCAPFPFIVTG